MSFRAVAFCGLRLEEFRSDPIRARLKFLVGNPQHAILTLHMAHDVFISHSSRDKTIADATVARLESAGIRCWIAPRDVVPGADWSASILDAIDGARVMVLLLSQHSNASKQVPNELERAVDRGLTVIPMRVENVVPARSMELFLRRPHWLDAFTPPLEKHLDSLAATVAKLLEPSRTAAVISPPAPPPGSQMQMSAGSAPGTTTRGCFVTITLALLAASSVAAWAAWSHYNRTLVATIEPPIATMPPEPHYPATTPSPPTPNVPAVPPNFPPPKPDPGPVVVVPKPDPPRPDPVILPDPVPVVPNPVPVPVAPAPPAATNQGTRIIVGGAAFDVLCSRSGDNPGTVLVTIKLVDGAAMAWLDFTRSEFQDEFTRRQIGLSRPLGSVQLGKGFVQTIALDNGRSYQLDRLRMSIPVSVDGKPWNNIVLENQPLKP